jgi:hypothetical protein
MTEKKQTAVEYLLHAVYKIVELNPKERRRLNEVVEKAKEMEKEVAQQYAEFAIECDRKELPVLEFDGWINLKHRR